MTDSNNELLRTIKIAELPVKTSIDRNSVLLIQDSEDTKQMSVGLFWDFVQQVTDNLTKSVNALMVEMTTFLEAMEARDKVIQQNETDRQAAEKDRKIAEQERYEAFEYIKRQWEKIVQYYEETIVRENQRIANEQYRQNEWANWTNIQAQWTTNESSRQIAEEKRVREFNDIKAQWSSLKKDVEDTKVSLVNRVTDMINECRATETQLTTNVNNIIAECNATENTLTTKVNNAIDSCNQTKANLSATVEALITECRSTENTLTTNINNSINSCTAATNTCISVTNKLNSMFILGTTVPENLDNGKVYLQYFT